MLAWGRYVLATALVVFLLYLLRLCTPRMNGENEYFPIRQKAAEVLNNEERLKVADLILHNFNWSTIHDHKNASIKVSFVASDRNSHFLSQSVAYFLKHISEFRSVPEISICNTEPAHFPEMDFFVGKVNIHDINGGKTIRPNLSTLEGRIGKETADYWKCLRALSVGESEFVLLIEDDALIVPSFASLLESLVQQLHTPSMQRIDFVKLYHPWSLRKIPFVFQSIASSLLLAAIASRLCFGRWVLAGICVSAVCAYLVLRTPTFYELFADLRWHLTHSAYVIPPESCCTPAVLFRTSQLPKMLAEWETQPTGAGHAKDHILDESSFVGRATDRNWIVHVGHYSTIRHETIRLDPLQNA